ncbi:MAG: hypothetical protein AB2401_02445 [Bacillus sp. (in: firmicutes)]|uniref:hypothetical protein n=1 Tax=Bacillus marasmi TaxID=1926279 RepID=UPI0011C7DD3E|nr:hypothetical protein [Bacillus marasmi]
MNRVEIDRSLEQNQKLELLIESLIAMLGRSNQRLDELTLRINQVEQFIIEAAPTVPPSHDDCFSIICQKEKTVPRA